MEKNTSVNIPEVTRFVREVIGCNCPDEVFERIEVRRGSSAVQSCSVDSELRIGGRLLVVVTSEAVESLTAARLDRIISEGRQARDDAGFNRFRLVVQADNAAQHRTKLLQAFQGVPSADDKTHLHVVERGEVPEFFK